MAIDPNDEILQDFLIEAGELLEGLNEQLIDLEQHPDDRDLLNAVFRSFHTIKGGAGFLSLEALVTVCHHAEDVFNLLRNGERQVDGYLMDVMLQVLDTLNRMFGELRSGVEPPPAAPDLVESLRRMAANEDVSGALPETTANPLPDSVPPQKADEPPDPAAGGSELVGADDEITDDEFEALLDTLHGEGVSPGERQDEPESVIGSGAAGGDLISDDEFENLLDELQAQGKGPPTGSVEVTAAHETAKEEPSPVAESRSPAPSARGSAAAPARPVAQGETSVRVDTARLDEIMNLVGELVLVRNRLSMLRSQHVDDELGKAISSLALVTSDLQTSVMKTRMQPVKKVFNRFPRVIRDLSRSLGKEIDLQIYGEETDLDKNLVEALSDPLVHLVRNAVDHGIESPAAREAAGKPRQGTVVLGAGQEGDHIALMIQDDGAGMDPQVLRLKAVEKGLMEPAMAERMNDREAFNVIFMAGLSTKTEISDVSGRGVGLDVVKTRISQLNGSIEIDSEVGVGTTLRIKLPLTLAILPALMVILEGRRFAIPLTSVSEILDLDLTKTHYVDDQEVMVVRNQALPIHYLKRWMKPGFVPEARTDAHVVVVHIAERKVGLVVDGLVGQEEIVIKPLGQNLQGVKGLAGATITGDGGIALILDVSDLVTLLTQQQASGMRTRRPSRAGEG